jgi:hypothetical protein
MIPSTQKLPAGHGEEAVEPAGQFVPLLHWVLVLGFGHAYPAGQMSWAVEPVAQKYVRLHATCSAGFAHTDPRAQRVLPVVEPAGQNVPETHGI